MLSVNASGTLVDVKVGTVGKVLPSFIAVNGLTVGKCYMVAEVDDQLRKVKLLSDTGAWWVSMKHVDFMGANVGEVIAELPSGSSIHCNTLDSANAILYLIHYAGFEWASGNSTLERNNWDDEKEDTCYILYRNALPSHITYDSKYRLEMDSCYTIISIEELVEKAIQQGGEVMTRGIEDVKEGMMVVIRDDLEEYKHYGNDVFTSPMQCYAGEVVEVADVFDDARFCIVGTYFMFTPEMVDWKATDELEQKHEILEVDTSSLKGLAVVCVTKESDRVMRHYLHNLGFMWKGGECLLTETYFFQDGKETVFFIEHGDRDVIAHDSLTATKECLSPADNMELIDFEQFVDTRMDTVNVMDMQDGVYYIDVTTSDKFKLSESGVLLRDTNGGNGYQMSNLRYKSLKALRMIPIAVYEQEEEFPQVGGRYYYVEAISFPEMEVEVECETYDGSYFDTRLHDTVGIFRTKKEAEEAGRNLVASITDMLKGKLTNY